jgi:hypothetical protein
LQPAPQSQHPDHDLPTLREAPAALVLYTTFLRVVVGLVPTGATMLTGQPPAQVWGAFL